MGKRIILLIGVGIILITCIIRICIVHTQSNKPIPIEPIVPSFSLDPMFFQESAKTGLKEALIFYNIQHPDIVYAQAILETGYFKSVGCVKYNNLFGLYNSKTKRYCRFNHWTESVVAYKEWIQQRYNPQEDYYRFLTRIHYASDPAYISKLKQIVKKEYDKKRYTERDTFPRRA